MKTIIHLLLILTTLFLLGCQEEQDFFIISSDGSFEKAECQKRGLENSIIMIESKYCGHCKATLPIFKEACKENGIEPIIIDVTKLEEKKQLEEFGIQVQYTPTFIFNCNYFIGTKNKSEYVDLITK